MCHKLFQTYGCGHTREICTTPCVHALATATPASPTSLELPLANLEGRTSLHPGLALGHRPSTDSVSSLPLGNTVANKGNLSLPSQTLHGIRTSSLSNLTSTAPRGSPNFTPSRLRDSVVSIAPPPYTHNAASRQISNLAPPPSIQTNTDPALGQREPEMIPNFCTQFFARYLPAGIYPCYDCYMKPEYERVRQRWMRVYADIHPGCKPEDIERMCGMEEIARKQGLVNVAREINTAESGKVKVMQGEQRTE